MLPFQLLTAALGGWLLDREDSAGRWHSAGASTATTWRTFPQAHWPALVAADFFTAEVSTGRGLVTYYVALLLDVHSRRIQVMGCTPYPNELL